MSEQKMTFEEWCLELDSYHARLRQTEEGFEGYGSGSLVEITGAECWRYFFEDGWDPEDALDEDRSCWE